VCRAAIDRPATVKFFAAVAHAKTDRQTDKQTDRRTGGRTPDRCREQTWNWVIGSPGQWVIWVVFHVRVTGSPGHHFDPVWDPSFSGFRKKCPKCKTYIWNAEMTKVIVRCLLLDWNHWMSVHAMNCYFYLWLLKILWPENTSSHISRHLEFITERGHRVNWVSGSLDSPVTGSLGHKMWPSSISGRDPSLHTIRVVSIDMI